MMVARVREGKRELESNWAEERERFLIGPKERKIFDWARENRN